MGDQIISDNQLIEELASLRTRVESFEREREKYQTTAHRLDQITRCFPGFTADPEENFDFSIQLL